jgi:hypothetical protein
MNPFQQYQLNLTRRHFFQQGSHLLGGAALAALMQPHLFGKEASATTDPSLTATIGKRAALPATHFPAKIKNVIYLHMLGGPSQMDLFDYKPQMADWYDKDLPESVRNGQRLTTMTSGQARFPIAPSMYKFAQHGKSGMWMSELLPYTAKVADELCFVR